MWHNVCVCGGPGGDRGVYPGPSTQVPEYVDIENFQNNQMTFRKTFDLARCLPEKY